MLREALIVEFNRGYFAQATANDEASLMRLTFADHLGSVASL
jgi:hypothetical protein